MTSVHPILVVAHPGHELTLTHWLERVRPTVFVLTDGSGQLGRSRLHSTTKVLLKTGARPGSLYGHLSDRQVYEAMLGREADLFCRMTFELADWLAVDEVAYVVGDSAEGYNPTHDLCRIIVGAAVELASRRRNRPIDSYEYVVTGSRDTCDAGRCDGTIRMRLDDEALQRKIDTALAYPELRGEVEAAMHQGRSEAFRHECLHPVGNRTAWTPIGEGKPYYEEHGDARVASGKYQRTVRYAEHMAPLRAAIWDAVERHLDALPTTPQVEPVSLSAVGGAPHLA